MKSPSRVATARAATRDLKEVESPPLEKLREFLETEGMRSKSVLRQSQTYMTSAGEVVVERTLYKDRKDEDVAA